MEPIKTIKDNRVSYLLGLETSYKDLGYSTKLNARCNLLEVFPKGYTIPKSKEEMIIEKWID